MSQTPERSKQLELNIPEQLFLDCVHCGLCTAACPTYVELGTEMDSPRGRIYLMRGVSEGRIDLSDDVRRHLELCLDCRSCETACPSGVQYGRLIEPFRVAMEQADQTKTDDWFHRWILFGLFPNPGLTRLALLPARFAQVSGLDWIANKIGLYRLLPKRIQSLHQMLPPFRYFAAPLPRQLPAKGTRRARVALFTGCVADVLFRDTNWATARVLQENGCEVVVPSSQGCCGAIHYHAGNEDSALNLFEQNLNAFDPTEFDAIIVNVAGCGSMLKDYGHVVAANKSTKLDQSLAERFAGKVRDISEFLVELGPIPPEGQLPLKATYHDACHLCHAQQIREQPRKLLELIPGLELVSLPESEICCGAAGTYNLTEPEMSERLAIRKADHIRATSAEAVFTANAGCLLQIRKALRESDPRIWVAHPIDALDRSYRGVS